MIRRFLGGLLVLVMFAVVAAAVAWRLDQLHRGADGGGPVRLGAAQGKQTLTVGCGDRVAEIVLERAERLPL